MESQHDKASKSEVDASQEEKPSILTGDTKEEVTTTNSTKKAVFKELRVLSRTVGEALGRREDAVGDVVDARWQGFCH